MELLKSEKEGRVKRLPVTGLSGIVDLEGHVSYR